MTRDQISRFDCIVIGAGIAGASVAAELSRHMSVALIERESQPGYHTTGRSAALFTVTYGPPVIRALTRASEAFFRSPKSPFLTARLLTPRSVVYIARPDQLHAIDGLEAEMGNAVVPLTADGIAERVPILRRGYAAAGLLDESASDIDVNGLHQHYLRTLKAAGGVVRTHSELTGIERGDGWTLHTTSGVLKAGIVVNAAGAWADEVARMAGVPLRRLVPKRRTALTVAAPEGHVPDKWAMAVDAEELFYMKPESGRLLMSPADEEPMPPCDAQPDEYQVALCVDRVQKAFDLPVRRIESKWAGLRSFFPDGCPVAGYDAAAEGFFWLAGQGGYGIQSAPAMARAAAALVRHQPLPADVEDEGVTARILAGPRPVARAARPVPERANAAPI